MDVSLGVSIEGTRTKIALLDAAPPHAVVDQSELDVQQSLLETLVSTVLATDRMLAQQGHRLVCTTICDRDGARASLLRDTLSDNDLTDVLVVPQTEAMTAVTRFLVGTHTAAALFSDDDTAALAIVDSSADTTSLIAVEPVTAGDRATAYRSLMGRFSEEPGGATSVVVLGTPVDPGLAGELSSASPVPLTVPERPEFAVALGAALAGLTTARRPPAWAPNDEFGAPATMAGPQAQHLAYSEVDDSAAWADAGVPLQTPLQPLSSAGSFSVDDYETEEAEEAAAATSGQSKALLVGSTVAAVVVVGFAALAVSVAINIRPDVDRQVTRAYDEKVAGKYFPVAPGQGVVPDGPAWTVVEHLPEPGTDPDARVFEPKQLGSTGASGGSRPQLIEYYRDGTVGVQSVQKASASVPMPAPPIGAPPVGGMPNLGFLGRIIPDFSRWSPCQVIALVANINEWQRLQILRTGIERTTTEERLGNFFKAVRAQQSPTKPGPLEGSVDPDFGLTEIGDVVLVPETKGALFATDKDAGETGVDISAIPTELFTSDAPESVAAAVLPEDTKLVEPEDVTPTSGAGTSGSAPTLSILEQPVAQEDFDRAPGITGTAPPVVETTTTDSEQATETVSEEEPTVKVGVTTDDDAQEPETGTEDLPGGAPVATEPSEQDSGNAPLPSADAPTPEIDRPAPQVETPAPVQEAPKAPEPPARVSTPEPTYEAPPAPEPTYEAPPAPEPTYEAPPAPEPTYEAPAPTYEAPAAPPPPPVVQAPPAAPPVQKPVLPRLSDLFPKRDRSSSESGSGSDTSPTTTLLPVPGDE